VHHPGLPAERGPAQMRDERLDQERRRLLDGVVAAVVTLAAAAVRPLSSRGPRGRQPDDTSAVGACLDLADDRQADLLPSLPSASSRASRWPRARGRPKTTPTAVAAAALTMTDWDPVSERPTFKAAAAKAERITASDGRPTVAPTPRAPQA
jgi:hypothetical protein